MPLLIYYGSGAGKGTGGQDIHNTSDDTCVADREHFNKRYNYGNDKSGKRSPDQAAQRDNHILWIVFQKQNDRYASDCHNGIGDSAQHGNGCDSFRFTVHVGPST